jgi:hypothetical protein
MSLALNVVGIAVLVVFWTVIVGAGIKYDQWMYWLTQLDGTLYANAWNTGTDTYVYPPPFAQLFAPLTTLPWPVFHAAWTALLLGVLARLVGPAIAALLLIVWVPIGMEVTLGNVNLLVGAAILLGFRWPAAWAFVLLTKVTPGIGLLWFVVRQEWRNLAIAVGLTAAISLVSFLVAPDLWFAWIDRMLQDMDAAPTSTAIVLIPLPLWFRLVIAAGITVWAARTDRPWALFVACWVAMPLATVGRATLMVGTIPLLLHRVDRNQLTSVGVASASTVCRCHDDPSRSCSRPHQIAHGDAHTIGRAT